MDFSHSLFIDGEIVSWCGRVVLEMLCNSLPHPFWHQSIDLGKIAQDRSFEVGKGGCSAEAGMGRN